MKFRVIPPTAFVALAASAVACVPSLGAALALDRGAVLAGEPWRWVTGHLVHWSFDHAAWDIATFAALGVAAERLSKRGAWLAIALSLPLINAAFWLLQPNVTSYRGLSGVDCALGAFVAAEIFRGSTSPASRRLSAAMGTFLAAKIGWELTTAGTVFVDSFGSGVVAVPVAHAAGAIAGLVASGLLSGLRTGRLQGRATRGNLPRLALALHSVRSPGRWPRSWFADARDPN